MLMRHALVVRQQLSSLYVDKHEYEKAQEFQEKVIDLRETILGKDHADVSSALLDIGRILILQGKLKEGEDVYVSLKLR